MKTLNLITFASVFQRKTQEAIREAHHELFAALDTCYQVRIVFEEELDAFLQEPQQQEALTLLLIATGGTEGMVVRRYPTLQHPLVLLTDGKANSLAASLELACWVRQQGDACEILHGSMEHILDQLRLMELRKQMQGLRIGVIGEPSDWLVSSGVDYRLAKEMWGVEYVDIPLALANDNYHTEQETEALGQEVDAFMLGASGCREPNREEVVKAMRLYHALKRIVTDYQLDAITLQCFSLIPTTCTTGCLALALLNDEGIVAGCEGDLQSVFTMLLAKRLTGEDAFMANPSYIDAEQDEILFAHCTIGLKRCQSYIIRSHFESQSGVAIQGILPIGDVTVLKVGGKGLDEAFVCDGELLENQDDQRKCRTQIRVKLQPHACQRYFLGRNIGNHHIIIPGHHAEGLKALLGSMNVGLK